MKVEELSLPAARCVVALVLLVCSVSARAQMPSPLAEWQYSGGILLDRSTSEAVAPWSIQLGGGATHAPKFEGSGNTRWQLDPLVEIRYRDRVFVSLGEGLGADLLAGRTYRAGAAIAYDQGRKESDGAILRGVGKIDSAPELKFYAEWALSPLVVRADVRRGLGGHDAWLGDLGVYAALAGSERGFILAGPSITFADDRYMRRYFGISESQAGDSGLPPYRPSGGAKSASFGINAGLSLTDHWFVEALAAYLRPFGEERRSPLVQKDAQHQVSVYLGYDF
jgi:outer membrane scaffolding protein for murein synthesis (MipA/OmpV family)